MTARRARRAAHAVAYGAAWTLAAVVRVVTVGLGLAGIALGGFLLVFVAVMIVRGAL